MPEKKCGPCEINAAFGVVFNVCSTLKGVNCRKLQADLNARRITKKTAFKKVILAAETQGKRSAARDLRRAAKKVQIKV